MTHHPHLQCLDLLIRIKQRKHMCLYILAKLDKAEFTVQYTYSKKYSKLSVLSVHIHQHENLTFVNVERQYHYHFCSIIALNVYNNAAYYFLNVTNYFYNNCGILIRITTLLCYEFLNGTSGHLVSFVITRCTVTPIHESNV